ncbi:uncharacterized protein UTRI_05060 [Ustilago trichophora]|uniref:Uncharacterized protein n=1 Tax=Ustilago trichophora TaxID=86804 RepID=A0A5C3EE17_9BASI|nr:uncharacterized protein UTRI_05060 [Ustilago trichophora]
MPASVQSRGCVGKWSLPSQSHVGGSCTLLGGHWPLFTGDLEKKADPFAATLRFTAREVGSCCSFINTLFMPPVLSECLWNLEALSISGAVDGMCSVVPENVLAKCEKDLEAQPSVTHSPRFAIMQVCASM